MGHSNKDLVSSEDTSKKKDTFGVNTVDTSIQGLLMKQLQMTLCGSMSLSGNFEESVWEAVFLKRCALQPTVNTQLLHKCFNPFLERNISCLFLCLIIPGETSVTVVGVT